MEELIEIQGKVKSCLAEFNIESKSKSEFRISGYASKPVVDRVGDIVEVAAFTNTMDEFMTNPMMLWMHDATEPIGSWDKYELRPDGLWLSGTLVKGTDTADKARTLIEQKALRALSIGFREVDGGPEEDGHYHIRRLRLLETSIVGVPANQTALFTLDRTGKCIGVKMLEDDIMERNPNWDELARALGIAGMAEVAGKHEDLDRKLCELLEAFGVAQTIASGQQKALEEIATTLKAQETRMNDLAKCIVKIVKFQAERIVKESEAA